MVIRANELHDKVGCERQETVETVLLHLFGEQNKVLDRENHNVNIMDDNCLPHSSVVTHTFSMRQLSTLTSKHLRTSYASTEISCEQHVVTDEN